MIDYTHILVINTYTYSAYKMMTTVEPIDELLQQKKAECQEKLNKTNESFEPGKQFMVLYYTYVWEIAQLNTIMYHNFRANKLSLSHTTQTHTYRGKHRHKSKNEQTIKKAAKENKFPRINLPLVCVRYCVYGIKVVLCTYRLTHHQL